MVQIQEPTSHSQTKNFQLLGQDELIKLLINNERKVVPALARGLHEEGQLIFRRSQAIVPFRLGTLKTSGVLFPPEVSGTHVDVWIGYGGLASVYAMIMHRGTYTDRRTGATKNFTYHKPGRKAQYLADPMKAAQKMIDVRLTKRLTAILNGR